MACGDSQSEHDLSGLKIQESFGRLVQAVPYQDGPNQPDRDVTPTLYDAYGNVIKAIKMQEAFTRNDDGSLSPTEGPFYDTYWEEDEFGNKQPRDIKFQVNDNGNLEMI